MFSVLAGVMELVDMLDLGSSAARRGGSTPFTRTDTSKGKRLLVSFFMIFLIKFEKKESDNKNLAGSDNLLSILQQFKRLNINLISLFLCHFFISIFIFSILMLPHTLYF